VEQKQKIKGWRLVRIIMAALLGFLLLAIHLPNTGGIIAGSPHNGMWRCGPFLFYPDAFFGVVGIVFVSAGCALFGIVRHNAFEMAGWILLGVLFLFTFLGG
jgi:hypothetical protein